MTAVRDLNPQETLRRKLRENYEHHIYTDYEAILDSHCDRVLVTCDLDTDGKENGVHLDNNCKCPNYKDGHCSECNNLIHHIYKTAWCYKERPIPLDSIIDLAAFSRTTDPVLDHESQVSNRLSEIENRTLGLKIDSYGNITTKDGETVATITIH